jgi:vacuolar-type H+-ATPase subunit B/Vma2
VYLLPAPRQPQLHTPKHKPAAPPLGERRTHTTHHQGAYDNRTIFDSLELAWSLLRIFPRELLRRITVKTLDEYYERKADS